MYYTTHDPALNVIGILGPSIAPFFRDVTAYKIYQSFTRYKLFGHLFTRNFCESYCGSRDIRSHIYIVNSLQFSLYLMILYIAVTYLPPLRLINSVE